MSKLCKIRVGITLGDPSGIGPSIIVKAVNKLSGLANFIIIGDSFVLSKIKGFKGFLRNKVSIIDLGNVERSGFCFGKVRNGYGKASIEYLDKAMDLLKDSRIDCLATAPISKEAINKAGFLYNGHTEYFIKKTKSRNVVMMLMNKKLRFSLVTRHIPLASVSRNLDTSRICSTTRITYDSLRKIFNIPNPRIAVCGLNPHASDNGLIGKEEKRIIQPAVGKLKKISVDIDGPLAADTAVYKMLSGKYDSLVAMYHDQALIPLKSTGAQDGVNITLGLPFIRVSPLHGTAFDIAGREDIVDPSSLISAIKLTIKCASIQKRA